MTASCSLALRTASPMIVQSDLLGPVTVEPEDVIEFPTGLFGFPECRSFVLLPTERPELFWLQATEHSPLAFLLLDPFAFFDDYAVDLTAADLAELGAGEASEVAVLAIVTLPRTRAERPTANLQGPLALNLGARRAKQLALANADHGVQRPVELG